MAYTFYLTVEKPMVPEQDFHFANETLEVDYSRLHPAPLIVDDEHKTLIVLGTIIDRGKVLSQDQIAASYGGFNKLIFKPGGNFNVHPIFLKKEINNELNKNLLLVYTGIKRTAHDIARGYISNLQKSKKNHILEIENFAREGEKILKKGKLNDFGRLLHESWLEKKCLSSSITNSNIDEIYNKAIKYGAIGGKLLGAGGGGFFLFYVPYFRQKYFIKYIKHLLTINFKF